MRLMRAVFSCGRVLVQSVIEVEDLWKQNLALHEESNDKESIVSGDISAVMTLIGAMSRNGFNNLDECWSYEC